MNEERADEGRGRVEQSAVAESVLDVTLEGGKLIAQPHHAFAGFGRTVARDNPLRFVGVRGPHRDPHLPQFVDAHRKTRRLRGGGDE